MQSWGPRCGDSGHEFRAAGLRIEVSGLRLGLDTVI